MPEGGNASGGVRARNPGAPADEGKGGRRPDLRLAVSLSGGRSSAYMLRLILDGRHGTDLRERGAVVFANTGKEREETLRFVHEIEERWNTEVHWVEYHWRPEAAGGPGDLKHDARRVSYREASRDGEPFYDLISAKRMLPTVKRRLCTQTLKVRTMEWYIRRHLGWKPPWQSAVGIRYDEPNRWKRLLMDDCKLWMPLAEEHVTAAEVQNFWRTQAKNGFDLQLGPNESNCDLCFMKGADILRDAIAKEPGRAAWWLEMERRGVQLDYQRAPEHRKRRLEITQFSDRWSFTELFGRAVRDEGTEGIDDEGRSELGCFCA